MGVGKRLLSRCLALSMQFSVHEMSRIGAQSAVVKTFIMGESPVRD